MSERWRTNALLAVLLGLEAGHLTRAEAAKKLRVDPRVAMEQKRTVRGDARSDGQEIVVLVGVAEVPELTALNLISQSELIPTEHVDVGEAEGR